MGVNITRLEKIAADRVAEMVQKVRDLEHKKKGIVMEIEELNAEIRHIAEEIHAVHSMPENRPRFDIKELKDICESRGKLSGVKYFKECTGVNLMDCKRMVEDMAECNGWRFATGSGPSFLNSAS